MLVKTIIKSKLRVRPLRKLKFNIEIMNWFYHKGWKHIAKYYNRKILYKFSCDIGPGVQIDESLNLPHIVGIVIGRGVIIRENVIILQNVTLGSSLNETLNGSYKTINGSYKTMPTIEHNVMILSGAVVAGKVTVGHHSIVAANAVVTIDIPPYSLVVGFNQIKPLPEKYIS